MRYARIAGIGMYLPERVETNEELSKRLGYDVEKYLSGIKLRHYSKPEEATSDMSVKAAEEALKKAHLAPEDLDLIILATDTPDFVTPPTSPIIQHKLGAENAGAFDINAACCDAIIGTVLGAQHIMIDPEINNVLVIGAYGMTKWLDWNTKVLPLLFGDGAGAVVLSPSEEPGYLSSAYFADGSYWDAYGIYIGTARPLTKEMVERKEHVLRFHPNAHKYPPDVNPSHWPDLIKKTVKKAEYTIEDLDMLILTQVRLDDIKSTMERLGLPLDKTHWVMDKFGYTGSACLFTALYDAFEEGKIKRGDLVCLCGSGAGMTMASALFKWV